LVGGRLLDQLVERTKALAVGNGSRQGVEMGPLVSSDHCRRVDTLDDAIPLVNRSHYGNATAIFTSSGKAAREYSSRCEVGMVGVNVGVAAPMAFFPFAGWKHSFFGDLHAHGKDAVAFCTEQKVIMSRWF